jgi:hypothetical protein
MAMYSIMIVNALPSLGLPGSLGGGLRALIAADTDQRLNGNFSYFVCLSFERGTFLAVEPKSFFVT